MHNDSPGEVVRGTSCWPISQERESGVVLVVVMCVYCVKGGESNVLFSARI